MNKRPKAAKMLLPLAVVVSSLPGRPERPTRTTVECVALCWTHTGERARRALFEVDASAPINWDALKRTEAWRWVRRGPPLLHEIFPDLTQDPRLGSISRDPITLLYWWE